MSGDCHFSLDSLPEKYRVQAVRKLSEEDGRKIAPPPSPETAKTRPAAVKRAHKVCAPIRMSKADGGPNATERRFNEEVLGGIGRYEPMTLRLSGGRYTPDWMFVRDGEICLVEVKGGYRLPTHGRSVMAFKSACSEYPMFKFLFAELSGSGKSWTIGMYQNGMELGVTEFRHGDKLDFSRR